MNVSEALPKLADFTYAVLQWRETDGYPMAVATNLEVVEKIITISRFQTRGADVPQGTECHLVVSHIRPQPGVGYDERRYIELSGVLHQDDDRWWFEPKTARGWDENSLPFLELCERAVPQARRYLTALSQERGMTVEPRMSPGWKLFLATRAAFLTATLVPVLLGVAAAVYEHHFSWSLMLITLLGAICIHLGLNIANDIFDALSGADELNVTPTMFSGGSRVLQYGLVNLRKMSLLCGGFYAVGIACGLLLVAESGLGLLWLGLGGILISWFYTAPPFRLVHRGFGELAVALGFGPIMVVGAYYVQTGHYAWRPAILSIPVALLVMLILYANEIPDRISDGLAGKRTLVVRLSPRTVVNGYGVAAVITYLSLIVGAMVGLVPWLGLIALFTVPLALQVMRGLRTYYDSPYQVMAILQKNILLHLVTGALLIVGVFAAAL